MNTTNPITTEIAAGYTVADACREEVQAYQAEVCLDLAILFDAHGPANERGCDWLRSTAEPWRSLAEMFGATIETRTPWMEGAL